MFLPLYDGVALRFLKRPSVTWALIAANIAVFALTGMGLFGGDEKMDLAFGFIPAVFFDHAALAKGLEIVPSPITLLTGMFLHGSFVHLAGNMLFLWVFGDNVEDAMGSLRFLIFYLAAGIGAALLHGFLNADSEAPLIGASGAIAGVIAAYLLLYPKVKVWGLALQVIPLFIPALWFLGFWFLFQIYSAFTDHTSEVGFWAHVGGFVIGAALTPLLRRREVPIFGARTA